MPRLKILSGRQVCAILREHGFILVRQRGSHVLMQLKTAEATVTIPVPDHREVAIGTPGDIVRRSGLDRSFFEVE